MKNTRECKFSENSNNTTLQKGTLKYKNEYGCEVELSKDGIKFTAPKVKIEASNE